MSLRERAESKAEQTTKATMKIGFIGQVDLDAGIVARFAKAIHKPGCFVPYSDEAETETRQKATVLAKKVTGEDHSDFFPCLWIRVIPDTSLTPTSRYNGSFIGLETPGKSARSQRRHGSFIFDHMSPECDQQGGKKFWVHIAWVRLPESHGGDLTLFGDDANDELTMLITYLPNKRAATTLAKELREGVIDMDALAVARGYDPVGTRTILKANAEAAKGKSTPATGQPVLSAIGEVTTLAYNTVDYFLEAKTIAFLRGNLDAVNGDVPAAAEKCGADVGDIAIALGEVGFLKGLMEATGLEGESERLVKVADDIGLVNATDLARALDIAEPAF